MHSSDSRYIVDPRACELGAIGRSDVIDLQPVYSHISKTRCKAHGRLFITRFRDCELKRVAINDVAADRLHQVHTHEDQRLYRESLDASEPYRRSETTNPCLLAEYRCALRRQL